MLIEEYNKEGTRVTHYSDCDCLIRQIETGRILGSATDNVPCAYTYKETGEKYARYKEPYHCWLSPTGRTVSTDGLTHKKAAAKMLPVETDAVERLYHDGWLRISWRHGAPEWKAIGLRQNTESGITDAQAEVLSKWGITSIILYDKAEDVR